LGVTKKRKLNRHAGRKEREWEWSVFRLGRILAQGEAVRGGKWGGPRLPLRPESGGWEIGDGQGKRDGVPKANTDAEKREWKGLVGIFT